MYIGREQILDNLLKYVQLVNNKNEGKIVLISGEVGIGKTELLNEFTRRIQKATFPIEILFGKAKESQIIRYYPFFVALETHIENLMKDKNFKRKENLKAFYLENIDLFTKLIPVFGNFLKPLTKIFQKKISDETIITHIKEQFPALEIEIAINFSLYLNRLQKNKTIIFLLDDIHWFDASSLNLLSHLCERINGKRIIIIGTFRSEFKSVYGKLAENTFNITINDINKIKNVNEIKLERFKKEEISGLIESFIGINDFKQNDIDALFKETEGNPLFLDQLLKLFKEENFILKKDDKWFFTKSLNFLKIPEKIKDVILQRLNKLPEEFRDILDAASVVGYYFDVEDIEGILHKKRILLLKQIREIEKIYKLIREIETRYKFDHVKIQEVLYEELGALRTEYHLAIAKYLEKKEDETLFSSIAYHYEKGNKTTKSMDYYYKSATRAKELNSFTDAETNLISVLTLTGNLKTAIISRANLLREIGECRFQSGNFISAIASFESALREKNVSLQEIGFIYESIGKSYYFNGEGHQAKEYLLKANNIFHKLKNENALANNYAILGSVFDFIGSYEKSRKAFQNSKNYFLRQDDKIGLANLYKKSGIILSSEDAIVLIKKALQIYRSVNDLRGIASCLNNIGTENFYIHQFNDAKRCFEESLALFNDYNSFEIGYPLNNIGLVCQQEGKLEESISNFELSLNYYIEDFDRVFISNNIANSLRLKGEYKAGIDILQPLIPIVEMHCDPILKETTYLNIGMIYFELNDLKKSEYFIQKSLINRNKYPKELIEGKRYICLSLVYKKMRKFNKAEKIKNWTEQLINSKTSFSWWYRDLTYDPCDLNFWD